MYQYNQHLYKRRYGREQQARAGIIEIMDTRAGTQHHKQHTYSMSHWQLYSARLRMPPNWCPGLSNWHPNHQNCSNARAGVPVVLKNTYKRAPERAYKLSPDEKKPPKKKKVDAPRNLSIHRVLRPFPAPHCHPRPASITTLGTQEEGA